MCMVFNNFLGMNWQVAFCTSFKNFRTADSLCHVSMNTTYNFTLERLSLISGEVSIFLLLVTHKPNYVFCQ